MKKLNIDEMPQRGLGSLVTMRVTGFEEGELRELKSMEHREASEKLIEILNRRNGNIGTCWSHGYGIYGIWFDNEAAYVNIGKSCD